MSAKAKTLGSKWAVWTPTITSVYLNGEHVATYEDWDKGGHYAMMEIVVAGKTEQPEAGSITGAGKHLTRK